MKEDKYTKSLAKNQVYSLYGDAMFVSLSVAQIWPLETRQETETSVFEFSYLCVNSSLEELITINIHSKTRNV